MGIIKTLHKLTYSPEDTARVQQTKCQYVIIMAMGAVLSGVSSLSLLISSTATRPIEIGLLVLFATTAVGLGHVLFTKKPPAVEATTFVVSLCVIFMDMGQAAVVDASRLWSIMIVVMDARLLMGADGRGSVLIVVLTMLHLLLCSLDRAVAFGLLDALVDRSSRLEYVLPCDDLPCPKPVVLALREYLVFVAVLVVDFVATMYFAESSRRERERVEASVATAGKVAQALADFDLDAASEANKCDLLPDGLVSAFDDLVRTLAVYRPFLQDACVPGMVHSPVTSDTSEVLSHAPRHSRPSTPVRSLSGETALTSYSAQGKGGNVTLMVANIKGFLAVEWQQAKRLHARLVEAVETIVHHHRGLMDGFNADRVMASFNVAKHCTQHAVAASRAALQLTRAWGESEEVGVSVGVATGGAMCGVLGSSTLQRFGVVGKVGCLVHIVERWATQRSIPVLCSHTTYRDASFHIEGRIEMQRLQIAKRGYGDAPVTVWELIAERTAVNEEWMYQLASALRNDRWGLHNRVIELLHEQRLHEALELLPDIPSPFAYNVKAMVHDHLVRGLNLQCEIKVREVGLDLSTIPTPLLDLRLNESPGNHAGPPEVAPSPAMSIDGMAP